MESLAKAFESILPSEILFTVGVLRASNTEISLVHLKLNQVLKKEQFTSLICWYFRCVAALWSEPCDHLHPVWSEHWHPCNFVFNQIQFSINLWLRVWVTCLHELTRFFGNYSSMWQICLRNDLSRLPKQKKLFLVGFFLQKSWWCCFDDSCFLAKGILETLGHCLPKLHLMPVWPVNKGKEPPVHYHNPKFHEYNSRLLESIEWPSLPCNMWSYTLEHNH